MSFFQYFVLTNNTDCTWVLDTVNSQNLGDAPWPATIAPHSTADTFEQTGFTNVNPIAIYMQQGGTSANSVRMNFFCDGVDPLLHVHMTMQYSGQYLSGSFISENNTDNGHSYTTSSTSNDKNILEISTTGNGSSRGTAIFQIG